MVSQIFKKEISNNFFKNFLKQICYPNETDDESDTYLILNKTAYKKAEYHNYLQPFLEQLKEYYYDSKKFYVTRKMNYNFFLTIIRQICNYNNIKYVKKITYVKSVYNIDYNIQFDN